MAAWLLASAIALTAAEAEFECIRNFGSNPGNLRMVQFVPGQSAAARPMVVVLHGGSQDHLYARDAGWDKLAEKWNFILLLPEQPQQNNGSRAFTWWEFQRNWLFAPRTRNEVQSIKQMMDEMKANHAVDAARVYITGLSAGGAMAAVMIACHPADFAGAGICSGLPHRSATTLQGAFQAMK